MSFKKLSRVFSLLKPLSKNQINCRLLNTSKTPTFTLTRKRNFSIYNLQDTKKKFEIFPCPLQYNACKSLLQPGIHVRIYSNKHNSTSNEKNNYTGKIDPVSSSNEQKPPEKKISLIQKMKVLYRDYWYILAPVHVVTSTFWIGSFYYLAKSGVDVVALMKSIGFSESITNKLENGNPAYTNIALAYALYKIATPVRYTVTLGATTFSINKLKELGYIKPIPPKEKLVEMYEVKKERFIERKDLLKEKIQDNKVLIQERYQDNKAYIQEKYSPEKCKIQLKSSRDRIINSWRRKGRRQKSRNNSTPTSHNGKEKEMVSTFPDKSNDASSKTIENDKLSKR